MGASIIKIAKGETLGAMVSHEKRPKPFKVGWRVIKKASMWMGTLS